MRSDHRPSTTSHLRTGRPHGRLRAALLARPALSRSRWKAALSVGAVTAGTLTALAAPASAALSSAGPIDPASQFPAYYTDSNGLSLQMCEDGPPLCLAGPEKMQDVHAAGGDAEAFYYHASATIGDFTLETMIEAAYAGDGAGQEVTFQRYQAIARGVTPNGTYTFTDPYTTYTCTADGSGRVQPSKNCREETTPVPGDFSRALSGPVGPFLTWDTFGGTGAAAPPAGFIGDGATPHRVVGSPTGFNKMRVSGPGIAGTCTNGDGSTVGNCQETDRLVIQGKVADTGRPSAALSAGAIDFGDVATTPALTRTLTYANTGTLPVAVGSFTIGGSNAGAFAQTNNCPATLVVGGHCTINVTFTPQAGRSSSATLTVTDDTPASPRTVALTGSNLPHMVVAAPVPPAALAFGSQPINSDSPEDNVVIGNTGNGPLTVASATITGASSGQFRLGTNGCTTPVAPDGGCEIGVVFAPTTTGGKTANLRVTDSNGAIVNVTLTGTGTTGAPADGQAPTVTRRTPAVNAQSVGVAANVTATFSEAIQGFPATVGTGSVVRLANASTGAVVAGVVSFNTTSLVLTINPTSDLASDTRYTATLTGGSSAIRDLAGNALTTVSWSFTTGPAPRITGRTPAIGGTGFARGGNPTVTFSEALLPGSVSGTTVRLTNEASGAAVTVAVSLNTAATTNRARVVTINPFPGNAATLLAANTLYRITLTGGATGIRDAAGNQLAAGQTLTWTFRTGA